VEVGTLGTAYFNSEKFEGFTKTSPKNFTGLRKKAIFPYRTGQKKERERGRKRERKREKEREKERKREKRKKEEEKRKKGGQGHKKER
jgi:hypothetical protein